jgi:hypothetical protein
LYNYAYEAKQKKIGWFWSILFSLLFTAGVLLTGYQQYRFIREARFTGGLGDITDATLLPVGDPSLQGKTVLNYGQASSGEKLTDPFFGVSTDALVYRRIYREHVSCRVSRGFCSHELPYLDNGQPKKLTSYSADAHIGGYEMDSGLLRRFGILLTKYAPDSASEKLRRSGRKIHIKNDIFYIAHSTELGQRKATVTFEKIPPGDLTVIARVNGARLESPGRFGKISYAFPGKLSLSQALEKARQENRLIWIHETLYCLLLLAFSMMLSGNLLKSIYAQVPGLRFLSAWHPAVLIAATVPVILAATVGASWLCLAILLKPA